MAQEGIGTPGQSGTTTWTLPDNLGTPRDTVNNNSAVVDHIITDSYGQVASQSNPSAQPWNGFAGGHADANTGDVTNLERRYDPSTGGWTTKDPIDFLGGDANTGRYAGNSPTNAIDPTGLVEEDSQSNGQTGDEEEEPMQLTMQQMQQQIQQMQQQANQNAQPPYQLHGATPPAIASFPGPYSVETQINYIEYETSYYLACYYWYSTDVAIQQANTAFEEMYEAVNLAYHASALMMNEAEQNGQQDRVSLEQMTQTLLQSQLDMIYAELQAQRQALELIQQMENGTLTIM